MQLDVALFHGLADVIAAAAGPALIAADLLSATTNRRRFENAFSVEANPKVEMKLTSTQIETESKRRRVLQICHLKSNLEISESLSDPDVQRGSNFLKESVRSGGT